tara:strand:- start:281 stop:1084 length:804 start_codon:yes stop_codon:yes gene_type:complete
MSFIVNLLVNLFNFLYLKIFSTKVFSKFNNIILMAAIKAYGYDNYQNNTVSGESFFITSVLKPHNPKLIIDIGGNVGNYSEILLKNTSANVILFEPLDFVLEKAKDNLSSFDNRIEFINMGVGSAIEQTTINFNENATAHASFSSKVNKINYLNNNQSLTVDVTTLDKFCSDREIKHIDFIKIDTEGFEEQVLLGAQNIISQAKPKFIQLENNWHQLFVGSSIYKFSQLLPNYVPYILTNNNWKKVDPKNPLSNLYLFSNFIFVRED